MDMRNSSLVTEFFLVGLTKYSEIQLPLFFLFLGIYIVTVAGNLGLVTLIGLNSHLHTPMYYFLFNLSFIDLCYSSVITPKLLVNFVSKLNTISYAGCMTQLFFYCFFVSAECYVLTVMAYDRYVAICKPLLYTVTMSPQTCFLLAVIVYVGAFIGAWAHTGCMLRTATSNHSSMTEFILEGLTKHPELQLPLFLLFLGIYVVTLVGNLGMILLISISSQLHSPMYYFLSHLSFIDLCYSSVITPKMLVNFISEKNIISFFACMIQLYFFLIFVIAEGYLLTAMAYDRYVAICSPLLYNIIMSHRVCSMMMAVVYSLGLFGATVHTIRMSLLSFCGSHVVRHYFCDILPLLTLSCSSTHINEILLFIIGGVNTLAPTLAVLISYAFILSSILHIRSAEGRSKAFGTCSSHL
ncbi:OR8D2 protein, partial [Crocuta crocuta]